MVLTRRTGRLVLTVLRLQIVQNHQKVLVFQEAHLALIRLIDRTIRMLLKDQSHLKGQTILKALAYPKLLLHQTGQTHLKVLVCRKVLTSRTIRFLLKVLILQTIQMLLKVLTLLIVQMRRKVLTLLTVQMRRKVLRVQMLRKALTLQTILVCRKVLIHRINHLLLMVLKLQTVQMLLKDLKHLITLFHRKDLRLQIVQMLLKVLILQKVQKLLMVLKLQTVQSNLTALRRWKLLLDQKAPVLQKALVLQLHRMVRYNIHFHLQQVLGHSTEANCVLPCRVYLLEFRSYRYLAQVLRLLTGLGLQAIDRSYLDVF